MGVAGVILAAEHAARLDRPKALLDFRGQPFVVQILQALEALEVKLRVVVLGPDAARSRPALAPYDCLIVETTLAGGSIEALRAALTLLRPLQPPGVLAWPVGCRTCGWTRLSGCSRCTAAPVRPPWCRASRRGAASP